MERINLEINDQNLKALATRLQETLSLEAQIRKDAEKFLETIEGNRNYSLLLLRIVDSASFDNMIRLAAAITLKNFVKKHWRVIDGEPNKITQEDRDRIKVLIIDLMLKSPPQLQNQLSDAVSMIGREDFPRKWPDLLPEMVTKFNSGDFHIINGVLKTAHSLFKRYRHEFKSQELWEEIKIVLDGFAKPLTELLKATMDLANKHASDPASLKVLFSSLTLISKVFYSLNSQDLPEYFEDNMEEWMKHFLVILTSDNKLLQTEDDEDAGPLELIKSQICDNVTLYAQKYDEEFQPYLPGFVSAIWNLLTTIGNRVKYDLLVSNAIQFLTSVCERPHNKGLFADQSNLQSICEKVIVPNMEFRDEDEEQFEDNPEEYIRRDIEGSDIDTRRRAACDFVRGLCKYFEQPVIAIFSQYVTMLLELHSKDPARNWKSKDCAIYLVTSLAMKKQTAKHGATQASELVNLSDFFNNQILPELKSTDVDATPVLKADSFKFVAAFRNMLSRDILVGCLPLLVNMLKAKSIVVHTYASYAIERIFTLKNPGGAAPISRDEVKPFLEDLLSNLFKTFEIHGSEENEYVMKAIMRSFSMMQQDMCPYMPVLLKQMTAKLVAVSKNPSKPQFNHYLFESLSCAIRYTCTSDAMLGEFENSLFPIFTEIIQRDVTEFLPYVFQILSLLLELRNNALPESHLGLLPFLLTATPWERQGNIPPMVRLLQAYIAKAPVTVAENHKLGGLLGVFQKLIASKTNDHEGFYLLNTLVENVDQASLSPHLQQIFILLFQRLSTSKTTKYIKGLLVFLSLYSSKYGAPALVEIVDSLQKKLFGMVLEKLFIAQVQKVSGNTERKICAIGITNILTSCPVILVEYSNYWAPLLSVLIGLFELPEDTSTPDDEHFIEVEDTPGYQAAYCQLAFAGSTEHDPFAASIPDAKIYLANCLNKLSGDHPGKITTMIKSQVSPEALTCLQKYFTTAGVPLT